MAVPNRSAPTITSDGRAEGTDDKEEEKEGQEEEEEEAGMRQAP
ncbi:hypothetical protein [Streptomyces sp. NPDC012510]